MKKFAFKSITDLKIWGLMLALQVPSLRVLYKYLPKSMHIFIPVYFILMFLIYAVIFKSPKLFSIIKKLLSSKWFLALLIGIVILANFLVYPIADGLKYQGRGSDQDDALIVSGKELVSGRCPYEAKTYFASNPLSPGPGWIILNLPFTLTGLYFLLVPFYLFLLAWAAKKVTGAFYAGNLIVFLCMTSLAFWETMVVGSDMFAIGALLVLCIYGIYHCLGKKPLLLFLSVLLLGLAVTSRVIFIYLIPVMGIMVWKRSRFKDVGLLLVALVVALALHAFFYFWNPGSYTPLHLLAKGGRLLTPDLKASGIILFAAVLISLYFKIKNSLASWLFFYWLCLFVPLFFVSLGDLIVLRRYNFALWEGANYLIVAMPVFLSYFVIQQRPNEQI